MEIQLNINKNKLHMWSPWCNERDEVIGVMSKTDEKELWCDKTTFSEQVLPAPWPFV